MSPPGRPKGEYRSAQHGGCLMSAPARRPAAAPRGVKELGSGPSFP